MAYASVLPALENLYNDLSWFCCV